MKLLAVIVLSVLTATVFGDNNLLFIEVQGIAAYHTDEDLIFYSHHPHDVMQKPSLGVDYISRLRTRTRDWGYFALQARLAYDKYKDYYLEPQLYNAYLNIKLRTYDLWLGHNKPALGLSSYLDNHALLLTDNSMGKLNFDRDWGAGLTLERQRYDFKGSITTGSGMPLYLKDSYLLAGRVGFGDLARDNWTIGISAAYGEVLMSMGYQIMHDKMTHSLLLAGTDFSYRYLNWELKSDLLAGSYHSDLAYTFLARLGHYLLPEDRLALELQNIFEETNGKSSQSYAIQMSYRLTPYTTVRALYEFLNPQDQHKVALQLYYYRGFVF